MNATTTWVGMDVHAQSISWAVGLPDGRVLEMRTGTTAEAVRKQLRAIKRMAPGLVQACYEAGPTGYGLQRLCESEGVACDVVAPSLTPTRPGDRIKTDRLDALKLMEMLRSGQLTAVRAPTPEEEAARSLIRRLRAAKEDSARAQHEMKGLLLFLGIHVREKLGSTAWAKRVEQLKFDHLGHQQAFDDALLAWTQADQRVKVLTKHAEALAKTAAFAPVVGALECLKGVALISAMEIATEALAPGRFPTATGFMKFTGLVPSEDSSGETRRRGAITKAGNKVLRRTLVESARHATHPVTRESDRMRARRKDKPQWAVELGRKAERRLHARYWALVNAGKNTNVAVTAVARELAGFAWDVLLRVERERMAAMVVDADGVPVNA